ncbi:MAG: phosphatidate cytidylyltransferase, partial [Fimbriimonadaceae bacterium]|nr:phosphatidate cytidylyltransferase [Alphaproteobacteria bacterium]
SGANPLYLGLLGAGLAVVSQGGDLVESAIKRHFGVKDSGVIFPGHGGIFDRVDGLISAAICAAALGSWWSGFTQAATGLLFLY